MTEIRNFGPASRDIKEALSDYSQAELVDLLAHLVKVYVIEGTPPLKPEVGNMNPPKELEELTFPQLLLHLQMHMSHPELDLFRVSGDEVFVLIGGREIPLAGKNDFLYQDEMSGRQPLSAPNVQSARAEHEAAPEPEPEREQPRPAPSRPAAQRLAPPDPFNPKGGPASAPQSNAPVPNIPMEVDHDGPLVDEEEELEISNRFRMLDID